MPSWLPLLVGAAFVALFASLGAWQIDRGLDKRARQQLFEGETGYAKWRHGVTVEPLQRLEATGYYDGAHQVLLDNIVVGGQPGYFVIIPLDRRDGSPLLLVNLGWIAKTGDGVAPLPVPDGLVTLRGRVGNLPRAGMKMGDAFAPGQAWPKVAVYPSPDEVAAELGRDVQDFVLMLDPVEEGNYVRDWAPTEFGPGRHFGYALQWFAMAAVLSGLLIWNHRKRRFS